MNRFRKMVVGVGAILFLVLSFNTVQAAPAVQRPISDFVNAQGTYCVDNGSGGCLLFVPPVANFNGWSDPKNYGDGAVRGLSMDYAGLADKKIKELSGNTISLGTTFDGSITERPMADGKAMVNVRLHTKNALTFVANIAVDDFLTGPLLFGVRATDVLSGATPVLGDSTFNLQFINPYMGAPMPDVIELFYFTPENFLSGSFRGQADGVGPDGNIYRMEVIEVNIAAPGKPQKNDYAFPAEKITLQRVGH